MKREGIVLNNIIEDLLHVRLCFNAKWQNEHSRQKPLLSWAQFLVRDHKMNNELDKIHLNNIC